MVNANNDTELLQALKDYTTSVDWAAEEDHFDTCEYVGAAFQALAAGVPEEEERELLGKVLARTCHQSDALPVILKLIYPLLILCKTGKLHYRAEVMEFMIDIAERHLYLRYRLLGLKPIKLDFIGDVYTTAAETEASINKREVYYNEIRKHTDLILGIIKDKNPAVSALAVKLYLLTLYVETAETAVEKIVAVRELMASMREAAMENLLIGAAVILQQRVAQLPESLIASVTPGHYLSIARLFNTPTTEDVAEGHILLQSQEHHYNMHPWADGYMATIACAGVLSHGQGRKEEIDAVLQAIKFQKNHSKRYPAGGPQWLPHQIMAEYLMVRFFPEHWASLTKVPRASLNDTQQYILQKLSRETGIFTCLQSYMGLPADEEALKDWLPE